MGAPLGERLRRAARSLGPAIPAAAPREVVRAAAGVLLAFLLLTHLLMPEADVGLVLALLPPFGASAVLVFAVPNSPLAQPWSAVAGNGVSALVAIAVVRLVPQPALAVPLAAGGAIAAMLLARALHPPGGAIALTVALDPQAIDAIGYRFALAPVALGTLLVVLLAMPYARSTGRRYPFRQAEEPGRTRVTADRPPQERLGLAPEELRALLTEFRQAQNVGVEDLARLIAGAEARAAAHQLGRLTCADIMSRDLVTVPPEATRAEVAAIFSDHGFTSLPVVDAEGTWLGIIFQLHLVRSIGGEDPTAAGLMASGLPTAGLETPVGALLPLLAEGEIDAVPVLEGRRIVGLVTRTDLVAALASRLARVSAGEGTIGG